jgi:hypothetical protein
MARQAGSAYVDFTARTTGVTTGMQAARAEVRKASREMKADIEEAQASIALLGEEVGVKLPRHLRSFVAQLPGVAQAMSAAFSGAAVIGLGMIAVEQAKKIYEAFQRVNEIPEHLAKGFEDLTRDVAASNDKLTLANDTLQNAINKFKGLPENKLKVMLDEATIAAVALGKALNTDIQAINDLMAKNDVPFWARILGSAGLDDVAEQFKEFQTNIEKTTDSAAQAMRRARAAGDKKAYEDAREAAAASIKAQYDDEIQKTKDLLKTKQDVLNAWNKKPGPIPAGGLPTQKQIDALSHSIELLREQQDAAAASIENMRLEEERAGQTGLSYAERLKKALEEAAKTHKTISDAMHAAAKQREDDFKETEQQARQFGTFEQEQTKQNIEAINKQAEAQKRLNKELEAAVTEALKGNREGYAEQYADFAAHEQLKVDTGQESNTERIDNLKAALAAEQDAMQASFDEQAAMYDADSKDYIAIQNEKHKADATYQKQVATLNEDLRRSGIGGALDDMRAKALDTAGMIKDTFTSMVAGLNDQLVNLMTGKKADFKSMAAGIASQVAKAGLQTAEGTLAGIGHKPGETRNNPLYVIDVNDAKKTGTDILSAAKGSPDPSTDNTGGGLFGSVAGGIWSSVLSALIPHATGGPVAPGRAYLVGERGPEPFFPGVSGTVGTNAAMQRAFGGGGTTINMGGIDARGSSDPAAVNAAVHRAFRAYVPVMVGASAAYQSDQRRRVPPTSGLA